MDIKNPFKKKEVQPNRHERRVEAARSRKRSVEREVSLYLKASARRAKNKKDYERIQEKKRLRRERIDSAKRKEGAREKGIIQSHILGSSYRAKRREENAHE